MVMNVRYPAILVIGCLAFLPLDSMAAKGEKKAANCSEKLNKAIERYNDGKHGDVILSLADLKVQCSGHESMDSLIYYLGMSYMMKERTEEAKYEFKQLIRDFPRSELTEQARFRVGHASFIGSRSYERDQTETKQAIRELSQFVEMNPDSKYRDSAVVYLNDAIEKLAKKDFMSARFYEKMEEYESAVVYYRVFLEEFPESKFVPEATVSMAEDLYKINRISEARDLLQEVVAAEYPQEIRSRARSLLDRIKKQS